MTGRRWRDTAVFALTVPEPRASGSAWRMPPSSSRSWAGLGPGPLVGTLLAADS